MQINLQTFLKQIANKEELKGNKLAWIVANYSDINKSDKKQFYESLIRYYPINDDVKLKEFVIEKDEDNVELAKFENKDFRIKSLKLANIRGIPGREDDMPFGITFSNNNIANNAVILGSNGSGKSSIYETLEYTFCQRIGEAELRSSNQNIETGSDYFKTYLSHFNQSFRNSFCVVDTNEGEFDIHKTKPFPENIKSKINPDTHFISDFDIYEKGQLNYENSSHKSFHYMIAKSLGLEEFLSFNTLINQFTGYRRSTETRFLSSLTKDQKKLLENTKLWSEEIDKRKKQLVEIEKATKNISSNIDLSQYFTALSNAKNRNFDLPYEDINLEQILAKFYNTYNQYRNLTKKSVNVSEVEFLNIGKELLDNYDGCPLCENSKSTSLEIKHSLSKRLDLIKEISDLRFKVKEHYNESNSFIMNLRNSLFNLLHQTTVENERIINIPDFKLLFEWNSKFSEILKGLVNDEFIAMISKNDDNNSSSESSFKLLFDSILSNKNSVKEVHPSYINELHKYQKEREKILSEIEISIKSKSQLLKPFEQKTILNKEIIDFEQQIKSADIKMKQLEGSIKDANKQVNIYTTIKSESKTYSRLINQEINKIVNESFEPIRDIVTSILKNYMKDDSVFLEIDKEPDEIDSDTGEVLSEYISIKVKGNNGNGISLSPNKYFNTFRYRLFSMMIGISVAIASRNLTKINLPLVLDDVFYASDFEKRTSIISFLKKLFELFDTYSNLPFQLILFTHDELIFDSVLTALIDINKDDETVFAKLLPSNQAEMQNDYWELSYRMPNSVPEFVTKELLTLQ